MQWNWNALRTKHLFLQVENAAAMQHVEIAKQVLIFFGIVTILLGWQEIQLHPGEEQGVPNPHDCREHMHEPENYTQPSC
jgi:hypothetical protein